MKIEKEIYSTFANVASSIGYSELHGRIIAILLVEQRPLSLQEIAKKTGYSLSSISLSLDLLEILGMIKKIKKPADKKLYVKLEGDILSGLKKAFILRVQKNVVETLQKFEEYKSELRKSKDKDARKTLKILKTLENEVKRLERYINILEKIQLPKKSSF